MDLDISGKTALVCASTRGLGFGVAKALVRENANVLICGRDPNHLEKAIVELRSLSGGKADGLVCDLNQADQMDGLVDYCVTTFGPPDILVYNNGGPPSGNPAKFDPTDFEQAIRAGFLPAVSAIRRVLPSMEANRWGRILCITSVSVKQPLDDLILSNTTRSALMSYVKTISRSVAKHGITVNAILPGPHATARLDALVHAIAAEKQIPVEAALDRLLADNPTGRPGSVDEFGAVAAFLCSAQASYINGQAIVHDGGAIRSLV